ncbi:hypothetical protein KY328_06040 [Candidatus Woesearchaeota archaeon]|nr:hypothetical protein [Candidatus Woesearchaeota archaeon]MBW3022461.1 hypothetical protein [Candidatus Woesearchaeota archaeon]
MVDRRDGCFMAMGLGWILMFGFTYYSYKMDDAFRRGYDKGKWEHYELQRAKSFTYEVKDEKQEKLCKKVQEEIKRKDEAEEKADKDLLRDVRWKLESAYGTRTDDIIDRKELTDFLGKLRPDLLARKKIPVGLRISLDNVHLGGWTSVTAHMKKEDGDYFGLNGKIFLHRDDAKRYLEMK